MWITFLFSGYFCPYFLLRSYYPLPACTQIWFRPHEFKPHISNRIFQTARFRLVTVIRNSGRNQKDTIQSGHHMLDTMPDVIQVGHDSVRFDLGYHVEIRPTCRGMIRSVLASKVWSLNSEPKDKLVFFLNDRRPRKNFFFNQYVNKFCSHWSKMVLAITFGSL